MNEGCECSIAGYKYLESRTHKIHVRVYLSRFQECPARFAPEAGSPSIQGGRQKHAGTFLYAMDELLAWVDGT